MNIIGFVKKNRKKGYHRSVTTYSDEKPIYCEKCGHDHTFISHGVCFVCQNCDEVVMKEVADKVNWK